VFLVNSRFPLLSATVTSYQQHVLSPVTAPLLPKLRGQFAEFLNHSSPDRLGILYLTTCVGLGYGPLTHSLEAFLGSMGSPTSLKSAPHQISGFMVHGFTCTPPYILAPGNHHLGWATLLRHPIACLLPARVPRSPTHQPQRDWRQDRMVSITGLNMGACPRVREYQPVVHRLRLSASP
jgi:hypothetical protein